MVSMLPAWWRRSWKRRLGSLRSATSRAKAREITLGSRSGRTGAFGESARGIAARTSRYGRSASEQTGSDLTVPRSAWKPGSSGNPGGRPKQIVYIRDLARAHTEHAILVLVGIMEAEKMPAMARVAAAAAILDRGW